MAQGDEQMSKSELAVEVVKAKATVDGLMVEWEKVAQGSDVQKKAESLLAISAAKLHVYATQEKLAEPSTLVDMIKALFN